MTPLLEVRDLSKAFGAIAASDRISIEVCPGEVHAVIGPNGAGKTTLVAQLAGEIWPDSGAILFRGHDITRVPAHRRVGLGLARSFQVSSTLAGFSVLENVATALQARAGHSFRFWADAAKDARLNDGARSILDELGIGGVADRAAGAISHGERRVLELAMALASDPALLLLDEPMAGVGQDEGWRMVELLRGFKGRYGILLVEHDMDVVFSLADRITVLVYGRVIASGTPDAIRADAAVRKAYLGEDEELAA